MRLIVVLLSLICLASPAAAERLWTEGALQTGLSEDTPVTFGAFSKLAEKCAPAVVSISTESRTRVKHPFFNVPDRLQRGAGSGVIIRADGYILSNNHVIENANTVEVRLLDDRVFEAKVIGRDPATDLAVLKVDPKGAALPVVPLGDSDAVKIGSWAVAIGNPMGLSHTVTAGIVSAKGRRDVQPDGRLLYRDFIQTDASINPGNSGGPLFNLQGQVIGINTAINARAQGIGFAIPVNMIKKVLPQLAEDGRVSRSWIGVQIAPVDVDVARSLGMDRPHGAAVMQVVPGGPAQQAGLQEEDVIVRFDKKLIERHDDLPWLASTAGIGRNVEVDILRRGQRRTLNVTLGRLPGDDVRPARVRSNPSKTGGSIHALGMKLGTPDRALRTRLDLSGGVAVLNVDAGSTADKAGVRRGDVILRCNGERVKGPKALARLLEKTAAGKMVRLLVQREGGRAFIAFTR
jgi:serine protease Do